MKPFVPDGAAEEDGVLEDDGQARPEGLQRQLGNVDVIDDNPPCERRKKRTQSHITSNCNTNCSKEEGTLSISDVACNNKKLFLACVLFRNHIQPFELSHSH